MKNARRSPAPPEFLRVAAHPLRWQVLTALAISDRRVGELVGATGQPQNLVSYHLARLRKAGLVAARRSSADARDTYYRADMDRCAELLAASGAALHPGLEFEARPARPADLSNVSVLFVCTGNSARSQIAEALFRQMTGGAGFVTSAGSRPKPLHPNAVRVMAERGIDITGQQSRHFDAVASQTFTHVVSLCDRAREVCPEFPGLPTTIHWSIPDPTASGATDDETYPAFEAVASELETRIRYFIALIASQQTQEAA